MASPVTRPRRSAKKYFVLLLLLAGIGTGVWWKFFRPDPYGSTGFNNSGADGSAFPDSDFTRYQEERPLMGTVFKVAVYAPEEEAARLAITEAFARAEEINAICSDYDPESELSRLNAHQGDDPVSVSPTLATVLAHARATADATDGLYDPTLGTLTQLWRKARDTSVLPDAKSLAAAREATGWDFLQVNLDENTVRIHHPGLLLDLGGIAKGFAADEMLAVLKRRGFTRAFIAAGGDIRLGDPPPGARAWRVGLRTLGPNVGEVISIANCAVSTSGDLHQFVVLNGKRYSHIIDPGTGLGLHDRIAASVIAPTATQTDPLATFCCISPETALVAFAGGDIACRIVTIKGLNPSDQRSPHFPRVDVR